MGTAMEKVINNRDTGHHKPTPDNRQSIPDNQYPTPRQPTPDNQHPITDTRQSTPDNQEYQQHSPTTKLESLSIFSRHFDSKGFFQRATNSNPALAPFFS
jgi:hypothetical protein